MLLHWPLPALLFLHVAYLPLLIFTFAKMLLQYPPITGTLAGLSSESGGTPTHVASTLDGCMEWQLYEWVVFGRECSGEVTAIVGATGGVEDGDCQQVYRRVDSTM